MIIPVEGAFMDIFRVLGNRNRISMLKILMKKPTHISGLAKELGISVPVTLRHAQTLEQSGLIERQKTGNTHVLTVREEAMNKVKKAFELFEKPLAIEVPKGTKMLDALKKVSGLTIEETKEGAFITEVDGKKGYFIYEVNCKIPDAPVDKFRINKNLEVEFKQLLPVFGKKISIKAI